MRWNEKLWESYCLLQTTDDSTQDCWWTQNVFNTFIVHRVATVSITITHKNDIKTSTLHALVILTDSEFQSGFFDTFPNSPVSFYFKLSSKNMTWLIPINITHICMYEGAQKPNQVTSVEGGVFVMFVFEIWWQQCFYSQMHAAMKT